MNLILFLLQSDFGSYYTHMADSIFSHDNIPPADKF